MKTKPTRFTGWAGKNLAVSLATRPRRSTTTHGTGDARKEHVFRIEAPSATVKRPGRREVPSKNSSRVLSASLPDDLHPFFTQEFGARQLEGWVMGKQGRRLAMAQWDVFSSKPLEGNSLAVFFDARGLSDADMQSIAKEMNLSETTFICPRDAAMEREGGVRVRIFTVQDELPLAGHPTLGTAFALRGESGVKEVVLDLNVGKVPVRFEEINGKAPFGEMTQVDPVFGVQHDREAVARATGLRVEDFDGSLPIETVS